MKLKMIIINQRLILAANGHGGLVALKSLQRKFNKIFLMSDDLSLHKLLRKQDVIISSFFDTDEKLVICAAYSKIIDLETLKSKIIINTHPSLLPKYRGIHSLTWAMLNLEKEVGFTVHLMDEWIDNGDILSQFKVKVEDKTSKEIMKLFDKYILDNLGDIVVDYITGNLAPKKQEFALASWCCKRNLEDCILNFELSHEEIIATFKTLVEPYPLPMIYIENELYELLDVEIQVDKTKMHTGRVINLQHGLVYIKTKESIVKVKKLRKLTDNKIFNSTDLLRFGMRL